MADQGAKNLILPSRSGLKPSAIAAVELLSELRQRGIRIATPKCDVSSPSSLSAAINACDMPPIKGCINATMALHDAIFDHMSYEQWGSTIRSKVDTSWTLHQLFRPGSLDFFILLSSLAGIYGNVSQSNYAAGCMFQDALARQRATQRDNSVSIDIGWMRTIDRAMIPIEADELLSLLTLYCDPAHHSTLGPSCNRVVSDEIDDDTSDGPQVLPGQTPPHSVQYPMFSGFTRLGSSALASKKTDRVAAEEDFALLFKQATDPKRRADIVVEAIVTRMARALSIVNEDVDPGKTLSSYGMDSLMAVELRNWIGRDFRASVAVFDILGDYSIRALGDVVAERTEATVA
ncbi:KR domain-containing protein [Ustulina deusta]|nr:KR domain-containing protein [Ustulina deusta]